MDKREGTAMISIGADNIRISNLDHVVESFNKLSDVLGTGYCTPLHLDEPTINRITTECRKEQNEQTIKEEDKIMSNIDARNHPSLGLNSIPAANSIFNGIFGKIAPDMCRITMSGNVAISTPSGYKSYNVKTGRLTNCSNFAFNIGEDIFFVIPTNKVEKGDIILVGGKPHCVISADKNRIEAFCYEDSSVHIIVPEHHVFMNKSYLYGKIISMFGDIGKNSGLKKMMNFMVISQMLKGTGGDSSGMSGMLPMMMLMNGGNSMFDGIFDFEDEEEETSEEADEE